MPQWQNPPANALEKSLQFALSSVEEEIQDDPRFEDVIGIPIGTMTAHAVEVISQLTELNELRHPGPDVMVQLYCLGFVVGSRFSEQRFAEGAQ